MKIAIFGASGGTGRLLTEKALAMGHTVSALVRKPAEFAYTGRVRVVQGDAFNASAVGATIAGADAVLSALGARSLKREDVLERAVPVIVREMEGAGVRRIVALGSAGALDSAMDKQAGWRKWMVEQVVYKTVLKWPVESQRAQYRLLAASGLEWTMVMPPMLTNARATGKVRVDGEALPKDGARISREDVADFMLGELVGCRWIRRGVYVSW